jgi:hypothetical protein
MIVEIRYGCNNLLWRRPPGFRRLEFVVRISQGSPRSRAIKPVV